MSSDDLPSTPGPQPGPGGASPGSTYPPSDQGAPPPPRGGGDGFFDSLRRIGVTRTEDRWVGGVAGGVAERFGLDPLLVRGLLILSFFLTGAGIVIYAIAWALLPERDGRIHLQQAFRGDFDVALLGAVVALVVGFAWNNGLGWWGFGIEWIRTLLWIAVWVGVVWLVVKLIRGRRPSVPPAPYPAHGAGGPQGPAGGSGSWDDASPSGQPGAPFTPAPPASYLGTDGSAPASSSSGSASGSSYGFAPSGQSSSTGTWTDPAYRAEQTARRSAQRAEERARRDAWRAEHHANRSAAVAQAHAARTAYRAQARAARRGPGAAISGAVVGLALVAGAVLLVLDRVGDLDLPFWSTWLGAAVVIIGLGIVVAGLMGRRAVGLSWLAILAVVAGLVLWPFSNGHDDWTPWASDDAAPGTTVSEGTVTPRTVEQAEDGVHVQFGSAVVDLTELDLSGVTAADPVVVPISTAAGSTVVRIPDGEAVAADIEVVAGNATWDADGSSSSVNTYTNGPARFSTTEAQDGGARLLLDVDVRAGDLTIEEESR